MSAYFPTWTREKTHQKLGKVKEIMSKIVSCEIDVKKKKKIDFRKKEKGITDAGINIRKRGLK